MKRGYSLIELIVVFTIIAIVLPAMFAIFFTVIRMQLELTGFAYLRKEGDRIKQDIIRTIRNSGNSVQTTFCPTLLTNYYSDACVSDVTYLTGYDITSNRLKKYAEGSAIFMTTDVAGPFTMRFEREGEAGVNASILERATDRSVYVEYTMVAVPSSVFLREQSITYRFLVTLRK